MAAPQQTGDRSDSDTTKGSDIQTPTNKGEMEKTGSNEDQKPNGATTKAATGEGSKKEMMLVIPAVLLVVFLVSLVCYTSFNAQCSIETDQPFSPKGPLHRLNCNPTHH